MNFSESTTASRCESTSATAAAPRGSPTGRAEASAATPEAPSAAPITAAATTAHGTAAPATARLEALLAHRLLALGDGRSRHEKVRRAQLVGIRPELKREGKTSVS